MQLAALDAQLERLRARKQAVAARFSQEERKARNHALIVAGGMLEKCFDGGWQTIDWPGLESLIEGNREAFAAKTAPALPTCEASKRLRDWERAAREGGAEDERDGTGER